MQPCHWFRPQPIGWAPFRYPGFGFLAEGCPTARDAFPALGSLSQTVFVESQFAEWDLS